MKTSAFHSSPTAGLRPARTKLLLASAVVFAAATVGSPLLHAAPPASPKPTASAAPAASSGETIDATDLNKVRQHLNEQITLSGTPNTTGLSKSNTVAYLNFGGPHQAVALVFFLKAGQTGKASSVDDLKQFVGKPITVSGTVTEHKGDLQLVVESLDQIKTN